MAIDNTNVIDGMAIDKNRKVSISFSDAIHILEQDKHGPFLCEIHEEMDNELHIVICSSEVGDNRDIPKHSGNAALDEILKN